MLTVSKLNVRVQFDDPQLGSEQIKDIDVMGLGAEYDEALRVLSENAAIGDALERDEDRKMGLIFSKAKRRVSGMEKGLELAFMGKQFSLEDGVLSRENYGQVVLPGCEKRRTVIASDGGANADTARRTKNTNEKFHQARRRRRRRRRQRGTNDSDTFAPRCEAEGRTNDDNNGFANIAASQELSQHPLCTRTTKPDVVQRKRNFAS